MRILIALLLSLGLAASPAAAQRLGQRTQEPPSLLRTFGLAPDEDGVRELVEAAQQHPLGSRENPVRVGGPQGERDYIARLRCAGGTRPQVGQRSSAGIGAFGTIVDVYPLDCGNAAPGRIELVMDMYHEEHREDRAPHGFSIEPR